MLCTQVQKIDNFGDNLIIIFVLNLILNADNTKLDDRRNFTFQAFNIIDQLFAFRYICLEYLLLFIH